jgi:hypothetical protein
MVESTLEKGGIGLKILNTHPYIYTAKSHTVILIQIDYF